MMKKYILYNSIFSGENNAGLKAGRDAVTIAGNMGYEFVKLYSAVGIHTTIKNVIDGMWNTCKLCIRLRKGDIVFLQYPLNRRLMNLIYKMLNYKKVHIITLIHDIDFLREVPLGNYGIEGMKNLELSLLKQSEYLICHNQSMIDELEKCGLMNKMVSLGIFDYLYDGDGAEVVSSGDIIVAGNLSEQKAGYLYKLKGQQFSLVLYGSGLRDDFDNNNSKYYGTFSPDELISKLRGSYGLVWDGSECDTCAGSYGKYLRINNPHKVSLYLAAGLPVIVWKQSALYRFVIEHNIGFGIESINEIDNELKNNDHDFLRMNAATIGLRIRSGEFLRNAIDEIERDIK